MNNVNPALASAVQATYTQANGLADATVNEPKVTDKTTAQSSAGGNTTVTLQDQSTAPTVDYRDLAASQTVQNRPSVDSQATEANETQNGVTYSSNLQAQSSYYANQLETE